MTFEAVKTIVSKNNQSGLSNELIECVAFKESTFDPTVTNISSTYHASGLMGFSTLAAKDVWPQKTDTEIAEMFKSGGAIFDPATNVDAGSRYLAILMKRFGNDVSKALLHYGDGTASYAPQILDCEKGLKALKPGGDPVSVLSQLHKKAG